MRINVAAVFTLVLFGLSLSVSQAQVPTFSFSYKADADAAPTDVAVNGAIRFPSVAVKTTGSVVLIATNRGTSSWTISDAAVSGSGFAVRPFGPLAVGPGGSGLITLTFTPTSVTPSNGQVTLQFTSGAAATGLTFFLNGTGTAPNLILSYVLNPNGNQTPLADNDTIGFPDTLARDSATATVVITNKGNGAGSLNAIATAGDKFRPVGLPLLPITIEPQKEFRFTLGFFPTAMEISQGSLTVQFPDSVKTFKLQGRGTSSSVVYEFVVGSQTAQVSPNGSFAMPDTNVGATRSALVRIRNTGNAAGLISTISVTGGVFTLSDVPVTPANIAAGGALTFTLNFTPRDSGLATGALRLDDGSIALTGLGLGPKLTVAATIESTTTPIATGGTLLLPNTPVGGRAQAAITITNSGNASTTIRGINVTGAVFSMKDLPGLPVDIPAGGTSGFTLVFAPKALGSASGALQIEDQTFNLRGTGDSPPALPAVAFDGLPDIAAPLDQPSIGLTLTASYPLDVTGKLTLSFTSDSFVDDPAIQFAAGGKTIDFRIPANTTQAIFGDNQKRVQFGVGTVAGKIGVQPSFFTGEVNLTPNPAPSKTTVIPAAEPRIRNIRIGTRTANSFELLVTGYSTPRQVTQMSFELAAASGFQLQSTQLTSNVDVSFSSWYSSATSVVFGSQFTASVVFSVNGDMNAIQSVTVTAANARGSSTPVNVSIR